MGRVLLAALPQEKIREALEAGSSSTGEGAMSSDKLVEELKRVGERGFAIADQLHVKGQLCVAAPIRSRSGEVIAAVDVAALKSRFSRAQTREKLVPLVVESAAEMSKQLGFAS